MDNSNNETQGLGLNTTQPVNPTQPVVDAFNITPVAPAAPVEAPAPVVETPTPVAPAAPVEEAPAPVVETPAPVAPVAPVEAPAPVVEPAQPAPLEVPTPAPVPTVEPTPVVEAPTTPVENTVAENAAVVAPVMEQTSTPIADAPQSMDLNALMAPDPSQSGTTPPTDNNVASPVSDNTDEDLVKSFVGEEYDNFVNGKFNIFALLFAGFYMLYRKMFLYGFLYIIGISIINNYIPINDFAVILVEHAICAIFINKIYLKFAHSKVEKIKNSHSDKSHEELKVLCARKGGVSIGAAIGSGILAAFIILTVTIFLAILGVGKQLAGSLPDLFKSFLKMDAVETSLETDLSGATLVKNVKLSTQVCMMNVCKVSLSDLEGNEYDLSAPNEFTTLSLMDYDDYITLNIYYKGSGDEAKLVGFEIYDKATNEQIKANTKEELVAALCLYSVGTHTDSMKLTEIGTQGHGYNDSGSYTYINYTFEDSKGREFEMKYTGSELNLIEGNTYTITFSVEEGLFEFDYTLISVQ